MEKEDINNQVVKCPECQALEQGLKNATEKKVQVASEHKTNEPILNILVVGDEEWIKDHQDLIKILKKSYTLEYKTEIKDALQRLWHNSYDILLIDQEFVKHYTIDLTKLAYARSKPSVIMCKDIFTTAYYKLWKKFSKMTKTCKTMRQLMFPIQDEKSPEVVHFINKIALVSHQGMNLTQQINLEIKQYFQK